VDRRAHRHPPAPQAADDQAVSDLAVEAAKQALEAAGKTAADVDLIIVATTTPDLTFPATATIVQRKLGAPVGIAFDVQAVCSGFVYALSVADGFVARGHSKCALVIGAEAMTRLMDWADRGTCVLFGDGAGAVVSSRAKGRGPMADQGLLSFALRADGTKQDLLFVDGGPSTTGTVGKLRMLGNQVFKHAVINISEAIHAAADKAGVAIADVDWFVPHQANQRILAGVANRVGSRRGQGHLDRRHPRQHLGGLDSPGLRPRRRRRTDQAGPTAAARGDGRRPDLGRLPSAPLRKSCLLSLRSGVKSWP
jgi:3-oxoacyl-[acyl-carrier-protein] synthase-3